MNCEVLTEEAVRTIVCAASSGSWWLTPLILTISAATAAYLSVQAIRANRDIARKKASLDLIVQAEATEYFQTLRRAFHSIRNDEAGFEQIFAPTNPEILKQRQAVLSYLNHYELIAMGISDGTLDESVYRNYMRSILVRDWFAAEPFVRHIRAPTPDSGSAVSSAAAFANFEKLAMKCAPDVERHK
ncbi:MAG: DUF4760 domain-containing protein [Pseudomonadota bacterium]